LEFAGRIVLSIRFVVNAFGRKERRDRRTRLILAHPLPSSAVTTAGTVALLGGDVGHAEVDKLLLERAGTGEVLVLPTAAAYEHPQRIVDDVTAAIAAAGGRARGLNVLARPDAVDAANVDAVRASRFTYLGGGSPMHLRSVLKDTPLWDALVAAVDGGGVVAGSSAAAMVLTDPMVDPRGGAFTLGLGLLRGLAVIPAADQWSHERLHRTLELAHGFVVAALHSDAALVHSPDGTWSAYGEVVIHDGLAEVGLERLPHR
jgi:cyanophycinase